MDQIMNYVKPELIIVAVALYFLGMALKQAQNVKDKYIPVTSWRRKHCPGARYGFLRRARSGTASRWLWRYLRRSRREFLLRA